jgi:hypothetical protein
MSAAHARATRAVSQPGSRVGPENPTPGRDGTTRWKASPGSPPCARGSVSGPIRSRYSTTVIGQPWVAMSGRASGSGDRTCRKWTFWPSMVVVNCGKALIRASCARQS